MDDKTQSEQIERVVDTFVVFSKALGTIIRRANEERSRFTGLQAADVAREAIKEAGKVLATT